ncbi:pupal cuticle protein 20-like [Anthonomus grandis grandis]|uniref:pupal cuticle protein 20-like n=1 Tax=Anthonomus grandis grandis TaxID=2921223 RepID=UPI00216641C0|nr:pupal cuticle protein 20-like [Anthonomus grandis grandis]
MKVFILASLISIAACARLDHLTYLPPNQRSSNTNAPTNTYLPPFQRTSFTSQSNFGSHSNSGFSQSGSNFQSGATNSRSSANQIPILKLAADNNGDGTYRYQYETGNSISAEEQGEARGQGTKAHGSYSYTSPEGEVVSISYTADENGYNPQGSHIPTPPPIPEAILKSLQENAAAEARGVLNEGSYRGEGLNEGQYHEGNSGNFARQTSGGYAANGGYKY